jgi:hypothetical protein
VLLPQAEVAKIIPQIDSKFLMKNSIEGASSEGTISKRNASSVDEDSTEKAAKLKASTNLDAACQIGNLKIPSSFIDRNDNSLSSTVGSLGVVLGNNETDDFNALKKLRDVEFNRLKSGTNKLSDNVVLVEDASSTCSLDDSVDLEALNLICSEILEGLGAWGCDPLILQTPISLKSSTHPRHKKNSRNKNKNKTKSGSK